MKHRKDVSCELLLNGPTWSSIWPTTLATSTYTMRHTPARVFTLAPHPKRQSAYTSLRPEDTDERMATSHSPTIQIEATMTD